MNNSRLVMAPARTKGQNEDKSKNKNVPAKYYETDVKLLNDNTREFESTSIEYDVLTKYFKHGDEEGQMFTMAEIKEYLERRTVLKLAEWQLKRELKRLKWLSRNTRVGGRAGRYFRLVELQPFHVPAATVQQDSNSF